eukprot:SAG22_NODE_246_length_13948_cov_12.055744_18_plen_54_part_00
MLSLYDSRSHVITPSLGFECVIPKEPVAHMDVSKDVFHTFSFDLHTVRDRESS